MKAERMWTYKQIAEALQVNVHTVRMRLAKLQIASYRKPQQIERYVPQSDVNRLVSAYLIKCKPIKYFPKKRGAWNGDSQTQG